MPLTFGTSELRLQRDLPEKCRERRRRRIEMRRNGLTSGAGPALLSETSNNAAADDDAHVTAAPPSPPPPPPLPAIVNLLTGTVLPTCGSVSVAGRVRLMEDAIDVKKNLCGPEINLRLPVHFFGLYDGHAGAHVAAFCKELMHKVLTEEMMAAPAGGCGREAAVGQWWRMVMTRCFNKMDEVVLSTCECGDFGNDCGKHSMMAGFAGSTAVVAVLTADHIVVANCGDSRAVLCRDGIAMPLTVDQKADRADELARIESLGGHVIYSNGVPRVGGVLAMSRAIGAKHLKPFVISDPEVSFTRRDSQDEFLIIGSDGLWDVVSNDLACEVARTCFQDELPPFLAHVNDPYGHPRTPDEARTTSQPTLRPSATASAAAILARLALARNSADNISVIVVHLSTTFASSHIYI